MVYSSFLIGINIVCKCASLKVGHLYLGFAFSFYILPPFSLADLTGNILIFYKFRYEVLIENLIDPAHVPYAHYGVMEILPSRNSSILNNPYVLPISFDVFIYD